MFRQLDSSRALPPLPSVLARTASALSQDASSDVFLGNTVCAGLPGSMILTCLHPPLDPTARQSWDLFVPLSTPHSRVHAMFEWFVLGQSVGAGPRQPRGWSIVPLLSLDGTVTSLFGLLCLEFSWEPGARSMTVFCSFFALCFNFPIRNKTGECWCDLMAHIYYLVAFPNSLSPG